MKQLLVTGGMGFIGSNFIRHMFKEHDDIKIVNLDKLTYAGNPSNLKGFEEKRYRFVEGDVCDKDVVDKAVSRCDEIVHFAAETHVDRSIMYAGDFVTTDVFGTFVLLEAARKYKVKKFVHISTDEVYGEAVGRPSKETDALMPKSPYAASKAGADRLAFSYYCTYGLPVTISNCSNNYGPYQFPEKLIPLMILNALEGKPLPIYGDGKQIRDWLYVEDHCEAIWQVLQRGQTGESYNVGGNNQPTNLEIVDAICDILDELQPGSPYRPHAGLKKSVADRPGHDRRYAMNINKIRLELTWQPKHGLREGLLKTVHWYLEHGNWIQAIRKQKEYQSWLDKNYTERVESQK
jgi:dTDP-glucose 4,6-dehydratase